MRGIHILQQLLPQPHPTFPETYVEALHWREDQRRGRPGNGWGPFAELVMRVMVRGARVHQVAPSTPERQP